MLLPNGYHLRGSSVAAEGNLDGLLFDRVNWCLDGDVDLSAGFQPTFLSSGILKRVFNADLSIQIGLTFFSTTPGRVIAGFSFSAFVGSFIKRPLL